MNMQAVTLAEKKRYNGDGEAMALNLVNTASEFNRVVHRMREEHGCDSVIADKPFALSFSYEAGYRFYTLEWEIQCDEDRITVERPPADALT